MKQLRQALVQLEASEYRADPVEALRQWRLRARRSYVRRGSGLQTLIAALRAPKEPSK
jgi:hypothetical protein